MGLYVTQEAGFEVPAGWNDASMNMLEYARPGGTIRLAVVRVEKRSKELAALMDERLQDLRRRLPMFELLGRSERLVAGLSSVDVSMSYAESSKGMYQRSLAFVIGPRMLVLSVTGEIGLREDVDGILERAAASMALRQRAAG